MKLFLASWIILAGMAPVHAQPVYCLDPTQAWSIPYNNDPIAYISYYIDKLVMPVSYQSTVIHEAAHVPRATAQQFANLGYGKSPGTLWNMIRGSYPETMQAQDNCPLLDQSGHFILDPPSFQDTPTPPRP